MKSPVEKNVRELLAALAEETRPCELCGEKLYFLRLPRTQTLMVVTEDAANHFEHCPYARPGQAGRRRKPHSKALIDTAPLPE